MSMPSEMAGNNMLSGCWLALQQARTEAASSEARAGSDPMAPLVIALFVFATIAFVLASATMNAAALATFGRTALEMWLLVTVSLAADAAKVLAPPAAKISLLMKPAASTQATTNPEPFEITFKSLPAPAAPRLSRLAMPVTAPPAIVMALPSTL